MTSPSPDAPRGRREERTATSRARILEAAVACLVESGYAGATTLRIQARAGVSRGRLLHHFPSRDQLLVAASHHLATERLLYAFRDPVAVQLLDGITEVLGAHGVGLLLLAGDTGRPSAQQIARIPLDAAIFATCGLEDDPALDQLRARGVPVVGVEGPVADGVLLIDIDDRGGTRELARHLHDLGHRRVEMIAMPLRLDGSRGPVGRARRARNHYRDVRPEGRLLRGVVEVHAGPPPRRAVRAAA